MRQIQNAICWQIPGVLCQQIGATGLPANSVQPFAGKASGESSISLQANFFLREKLFLGDRPNDSRPACNDRQRSPTIANDCCRTINDRSEFPTIGDDSQRSLLAIQRRSNEPATQSRLTLFVMTNYSCLRPVTGLPTRSPSRLPMYLQVRTCSPSASNRCGRSSSMTRLSSPRRTPLCCKFPGSAIAVFQSLPELSSVSGSSQAAESPLPAPARL